MNKKLREQLKGTISIADNAYRTEKYMVTQHIGIKQDAEENTVLFSHDTFYERTPERDKAYEKMFSERMNIDGKRIKVCMSARTYVK